MRTASILPVVKVPVLSEQIVVALPIVSQALRWRTRLLSVIILFTENANAMVTASLDSTLRVWNLESGNCVAVLRAHQSPVTACFINADGQVCQDLCLVKGSAYIINDVLPLRSATGSLRRVLHMR